MNFQSLKFRIPAFFAIYLTVMILLSNILIVGDVQKKALKEKLSKNLLIAELMSKKIDTYLKSAMEDVDTSANYVSYHTGDEEYINYEISRLYDNYSYFDLVFFMNNKGRMVYSKPYNVIAIEEKTYTDRDYYNHILKYKESFISKLYISRVLGKPHFVLASPVVENGELQGLIAAGIPLKEIKKVIKDTEVAFNGGIWVTDIYGSLIVNPYEELSDEDISLFENNKIVINGEEKNMYEVLLNKEKGNGTIERDGSKYYVAITFVKGADLAVLVEQEEYVLLSETSDVASDLKYIMLIIIIVGIILGFILSNGITKPIQRLVYLVRKWSGGENEFSEIDMKSKSEIGELTNTFKDMATNLDVKVEELKKSIFRKNQIQQYLNNILMSAGSGIIVIDSENKIVIFNKAAEFISGFNGKDLIGKEYSFFSRDIHCDFEDIIENLNELNKVIIEKEVFIFNKNNKSIPCRIICSCVKDSNDDCVGYVFLISSLEVIRKMEEELKREDRLSIIGEFSSSIIHDIGNPLAGLSNLLELYRSEITTDNEKHEILNLIEDEISDLNNIVLTFLNFTKTSTSAGTSVDICQIVSEAVNILRAEMINRDIKLQLKTYANKIYVNIDRRNFKQAIINIIKNSIQAIENNGHIDIDISYKNDEILVKIKDNGKGIKEDEIKSIFEPFYTTKKDGTGLGLSTAYKTIRDNDGKLEVASKYREWTEFTITIPNKRSDYNEYSDNR